VLVILRLGLQGKEVGGLQRILLPIFQNHPIFTLRPPKFFLPKNKQRVRLDADTHVGPKHMLNKKKNG